MPYTIAELNQMTQSHFVDALGAVFEATPQIAQQVWHQRPFHSVDHLHQSMVAVVQAMPAMAQLALIQAHPDLGSRVRMAPASVKEQAGAGLDQLTPDEYERFQTLNQTYKTRFGFPFIIAVRNHTKASILNAFEQRLTHSSPTEHQQALAEIALIAEFRLNDLVTPS